MNLHTNVVEEDTSCWVREVGQFCEEFGIDGTLDTYLGCEVIVRDKSCDNTSFKKYYLYIYLLCFTSLVEESMCVWIVR